MEVRRGERDETLMSQSDSIAYAYLTCGYSRRRREEPLTGQTARWPLTASAGIPPSRKPSKSFEGQPSIITLTRTHALAPQKALVMSSFSTPTLNNSFGPLFKTAESVCNRVSLLAVRASRTLGGPRKRSSRI